MKPGRGGAMNSSCVHAEYSAGDERKHSCWGVCYPSHGFKGAAGAAGVHRACQPHDSAYPSVA